MTELRFVKSLYNEAAVDEAVSAYARFGTIERVDEGERWVVRVTARDEARERRLANELANHALGRTIEQDERATR